MSFSTEHLRELRRHVEKQAEAQGMSPAFASRRFEAHAAYAAELSERIGHPADSDQCQAYADMKLLIDADREKLLLGKEIDNGAHLKTVEAIKAYWPEIKNHDVTLRFVEGPPPICPACGHKHVSRYGDKDPSPTEDPSHADDPSPASLSVGAADPADDPNTAPDQKAQQDQPPVDVDSPPIEHTPSRWAGPPGEEYAKHVDLTKFAGNWVKRAGRNSHAMHGSRRYPGDADDVGPLSTPMKGT